MELTHEQVIAVAELARLTLTDEETALYREQLSTVLKYFERLQALDTDAIPPTSTVLLKRNVMRPDDPCPSMAREDILENAPEAEDGCFRVQAVLD